MRGTSGAENAVNNAVSSAERQRRQEKLKQQAGAAKLAGRGNRRV